MYLIGPLLIGTGHAWLGRSGERGRGEVVGRGGVEDEEVDTEGRERNFLQGRQTRVKRKGRDISGFTVLLYASQLLYTRFHDK
jgi:hypothetical protein